MAMTGRTCVVTGGSSGIGLETAVGLAELGAQVVLVCRDRMRGEAAIDRVGRAAADPPPELVLADLGVQDEVRAAAAELLDRFPRIHVLVNNAGLINGRRALTADGREMTFAVNHLAPFLLTNLLLDRMVESAPARIVTVSSDAHRAGTMAFDDLEGERRYGMWTAYGQSKLANVLFTTELARRLEGTGVTATCLHPGLVRSRFARNNGPLGVLAMAVATPFTISPRRGALESIRLASASEMQGRSGGYYAAGDEQHPSPEARDPGVAARLWAVSERMTGLAA